MTKSRRAPGKAVTRRPGKQKKTIGQWSRRILLWATAAGLAGAVVALAVFVYLYQTMEIPDENAEFTTQTTFVYYADGDDEVGRYAKQNRVAVPLDDVPDTLKDAVVSAENNTFWTDSGIDPKGIVRAAFSNARAGETVAGGSTITQQYVKILYLSSERKFTRKVKEAILSLKIQRQMSKQEILEGYLNTIYFGRGAYGVQAASQAYFGKDVKNLNLRQSAMLASVLNSPSALDPANGPDARERLKERFDYTLNRMVIDGNGQFDAARAEKASRKLPKFPRIKAQSAYGGQRGHMLKLVRDELLRIGYSEEQIDGGGLRVTTTLDKDMMAGLQEAVLEQRPEGFDDDLHIGAASVQPGTGALKAFYGGQDYLDSQINWAATGGMAGSTLKAFTVAAALEEGFSLRDSFQGNSPFTYPDGLKVNNAGEGASDMGRYVSMTTATARSTNTAFVDMTYQMENGPKKVYDTMLATGVPPEEVDPDHPGMPMRTPDLSPKDTLITLGKARVSPINMANSYATFANFGQYAPVHVVTKVVEPNGETWKRRVRTDQVIDPDVNADTVAALQAVVTNGSGSAARALGRPAAGKTGTATAGVSNDDVHVSSSWFVGFTPQLSTAVMYVRGDGDDQLDGWLPSFYGGSYPAATWTAIMERLSEGMEVEDFPPAANSSGTREPVSRPAPPPVRSERPKKTEPTRTPKPRPTRTPKPEPTPEPTPTPTPTQTPEPEPTPTPTEPTTPPSPDPTVPTTPPGQPGGGGGPGGGTGGGGTGGGSGGSGAGAGQ